MSSTDRDNDLRYAMGQLEAWLEKRRQGVGLTRLQAWNLWRAVQDLNGTDGQDYRPDDVMGTSGIRHLLETIDPDLPAGEPDITPQPPARDHSLQEFETDVARLRAKFAYFGNEGAHG